MQKVAIRSFQHTVEPLQGNLPELQQWRQSKSGFADSMKLQLLQALREKEQRFPAPPVTIRKDVLEKARQIASTSPTMDSILSGLNGVLESLDRLSFNAFFMVVVWIGRICSHCCSPIGPPEYLRPDYWTHDPYSNLDRHLAVFFPRPEAKVPPDLSSTRIQSDFCRSIITALRNAPLGLFESRWNLMPIILPSSWICEIL